MKSLGKTLFLAFLILCSGFAGAQAGWIENGVPLTRQWGAPGEGVIASDGSSGAIIAYQVCRAGTSYIVAQHVDSLGVLLWGQGGIDVCTATGNRLHPLITSDGEGGAIITWEDWRNGSWDIYAQRVNASGAVQWAANGVALCTAPEDQYLGGITSDGAGGAIATWNDPRDGSLSVIYAQRVNASGSVQWTTDGVALCTAPVDQWGSEITSDGVGGAIVTWYDYRGGNNDIYAQRVNASGAVLWLTDGVPLCTATGDQQYPAIASDGAGGAIVTWRDYRSGNNDIYAQRVNASGAPLWTIDGVALCAATGDQYSPTITSDGAGGAIVTWSDYRSGSFFDIYAQRVNVSGAVEWSTDGVALCTATGDQWISRMISDGEGGAIVTWQDSRSGNDDIYAQRVNASGVVLWATDGVAVCTATGEQQNPAIASDGAGGAVVAWLDGRTGNVGIYAQRVNASGAVQWTIDGVSQCPAAWGQIPSTTVSDGAGGAIVTWMDFRNGNPDIYAQRLNASGSVLWATDGVALCTATGEQWNPTITSDGAGGAIVTWEDWRNGSWDIYAQRVNASGAVEWATDGVVLCTATGSQPNPEIVSDGVGGGIVVWNDNRSGNINAYAQRVDASGVIQWTPDGVAVFTATGDHAFSTIVSDGAGGAIIVWHDNRGGSDHDVYAQRMNASGEIQWTPDGVVLCAAPGNQYWGGITVDGFGGAIVAWYDFRSGSFSDIYAQRVNALGEIQWTPDGVALCTAPGDQQLGGVASDGAGGAIAAWNDYSSGSFSGIYVQKVNASGAVQWTTDGENLCAAPGDQHLGGIVSDAAGGAIVTWEDRRNGSRDIYAQKVNASGAVLWLTDGVALCTATGDQISPMIASDSAGGAIVSWEDSRCGSLIYAQRIRTSGEIVATTLQNYSAALEGASIRIDWALSEIDRGVRFSILRASAPDWKYAELDGVVIAQDGFTFTFTDGACVPGTSYKYRVECDVEGTVRRILFETDAITMSALPLVLHQNYPNPFNPSTAIRFYLPEAQEIFLDIYNVAGERVARLAEGRTEKGYHEVTWNGQSSSGTVCSSGVYFSRLKAGKSTISRKMVIMR